ncbi:C40 family peptidase [Emticicia fluvialis]|uniref:C40 family peptidase n=1 Tax=Emticicia fluvialis TaxID=2974474 RepID=UPI002165B709|nr:C40 family peptidase [Emticicia fluvialis]
MLKFKKNLKLLCLLFLVLGLSSCHVFRTKSNTKTVPSRVPNEQPVVKTKAETSTLMSTANLIKVARSYTGVPYRSGGNDQRGIDCSGLICNSFKEFGMKLPRVSRQQSEFFPAIDIPNIQKGDLVFFATTSNEINHSGIVTEVRSEDEIIFIHASSSKGVREDNMMNSYWKARFARACRPQFVK